MTTDLDALEALAKAATPGPWEADTNHPFSADLQGVFAPDQRRYVVKADMDQQPENGIDPVFIAAADPSTILALIAELRQERERADENADAAQGQNDLNRELGAALSRAEETIEKALERAERSSVYPLSGDIRGILKSYAAQKEQA